MTLTRPLAAEALGAGPLLACVVGSGVMGERLTGAGEVFRASVLRDRGCRLKGEA